SDTAPPPTRSCKRPSIFPCASLHLLPEPRSRIFRMQLCQLPQNLLGPLILYFGRDQTDLDDLIAVHTLARVKHSFFPQAELLAVMRARGDLEQRASIDGGNFDLRAQACFGYRHRHSDFDVVAVSLEDRVRLDTNRDVEIARRHPHRSGVPFPCD